MQPCNLFSVRQTSMTFEANISHKNLIFDFK